MSDLDKFVRGYVAAHARKRLREMGLNVDTVDDKEIDSFEKFRAIAEDFSVSGRGIEVGSSTVARPGSGISNSSMTVGRFDRRKAAPVSQTKETTDRPTERRPIFLVILIIALSLVIAGGSIAIFEFPIGPSKLMDAIRTSSP